MAMESASIAPVEKEGVQGAPDAGAQKLASAFRKKKKKSAPPQMPMKGSGY